MIQEILSVLDLEETALKVAPYYAPLVFALLWYIQGYSLALSILSIISVLISVCSVFFLRNNSNVKDIKDLITKEEEDLELAKKIGQQKIKGFFFRSILSLMTFIIFIVAFCFIVISLKSNPKDILFIIFSLLGLFILFYSLVFTLKNAKRIIKTPKLIKQSS